MYVVPLGWKTKFHARRKQLAKLEPIFFWWPIIFFRLPFLDTRWQDKRFWSDSMNLIYSFNFFVNAVLICSHSTLPNILTFLHYLLHISVLQFVRYSGDETWKWIIISQQGNFLWRSARFVPEETKRVEHVETSFHIDTTDRQRTLHCRQPPSKLQILYCPTTPSLHLDCNLNATWMRLLVCVYV